MQVLRATLPPTSTPQTKVGSYLVMTLGWVFLDIVISEGVGLVFWGEVWCMLFVSGVMTIQVSNFTNFRSYTLSLTLSAHLRVGAGLKQLSSNPSLAVWPWESHSLSRSQLLLESTKLRVCTTQLYILSLILSPQAIVWITCRIKFTSL